MKSNGYVTSTAFVQGALLTFHMIQAYGGCLPFNVLNHEAHFYRSNKEVTRWLIKKVNIIKTRTILKVRVFNATEYPALAGINAFRQ